MPSRDLWSHGSGRQLPDLLSSALALLLMRTDDRRAAYFSSPWMSDFVALPNAYRQFEALVGEFGDRSEIGFGHYLARVAEDRPVRIIANRTPVSRAFLAHPALRAPGIAARFAESESHEKGILGPGFYLEGSMNLTHNGVYVNGEKVTFHAAGDPSSDEKIVRAYLEFDRRWERLGQ
jgi:hypothetical protein